MTDERPDEPAAGDAAASDAAPDAPDDTAWEQIVASLRSPEPADGARAWPAAEDLDGAEDGPAGVPEPVAAPGPPQPVVVWRGSEADIDAEIERAVPDEHFVPPDPPPLPRSDALTWGAWLGVVGAPLVLLVLVAVGYTPGWLMVGLTIAFVAGFGILLTRLRSDRDPYDPDDGAVV
jgi:hypothetical protein